MAALIAVLLVSCALDEEVTSHADGPTEQEGATGAARTSSHWLGNGTWGFFLHSWPQLGATPAEAERWARDFDVEGLADQLAALRASHLIITVNQNTYWLGPSPEIDALVGHGELTLGDASFDLIDALHAALAARGIRLGLYFPLSGKNWRDDLRAAMDPDKRRRDRCRSVTPADQTYVDNWITVVQGYARRYGDRISMYWIDRHAVDLPPEDELRERPARAPLHAMYQAIKSEAPDSLVSFNLGHARAFDPDFLFTHMMDYVAGHGGAELAPTPRGWLSGLRWHQLTYLGDKWGDGRIGRDAIELATFVNQARRAMGAITLDVGDYRRFATDRGRIPPAQLAFLRDQVLPRLLVNGERRLGRRIEAETYNRARGTVLLGAREDLVGGLSADAWILYRRVELGAGARSFSARAKSRSGHRAVFDVRLARPDGEPGRRVGRMVVPGTGRAAVRSITLDEPLSGYEHVFLVGVEGAAQLDWFRFEP